VANPSQLAYVPLQYAPVKVKQTKTMNVNLLGNRIGQKDILTLDIKTQLESDVQWAIQAIAANETHAQIRMENPPTRVLVDNTDTKPVKYVKYNIQVHYGNRVDQLMIKAIENEVKSAVRELTPSFYKKSGLQNWAWYFVRDAGLPAVRISAAGMNKITLQKGSMLIYKPTSPHVGLANMLAARIQAGWRGRQLWQKGRSMGRGFMLRGIERLRRARVVKNYYIRIGFTQQYKTPGETYSRGTPTVIVTARRYKSAYRKD